MTKCINCFTLLDAKRSTKKYCCTECKNSYYRKDPNPQWLYLYQDDEMTRVGTTKAPLLVATLKCENPQKWIAKYGSEWFVGKYTDVIKQVTETTVPPFMPEPPSPPTQSYIAPITTPPPV